MNSQQRAKVYLLNDGNWEEICIGYVQIVHADGATFIRGILEHQMKQCKNLVTYCHMNENKEDWCMNLKVSPEIKYEQHGENIIQWEQQEVKGEIAISFIDARYASEIWNQLSNSKRHFRYDDLESTYPIIPSHQNLEAVQLQISDNPDLIISKITTDGNHTFLEAIKKIFDEAESQQHFYILEQLHYVIRSLIYLKNEQVLKCLLGDRFYMIFFGIMEYHSENKGPQRVSYRGFLNGESKFHQITQLDEKIMEKIHFNYRLSYLKESVMAYYLYIEDPIYIQFNQFINQNNQQILESLLLHHKGQFELFLQGFMANYEQNCKFINEFFLSFKQFLQIQSLNEAFVDSIQQTNLLGLLFKKILEIDQQQISFTTMQLTMMIANTNSQYLQEFLKQNCELFWKSLEKLLFSNMISVQNMIIEIVYLICQNQALIGQGIEWIKKCLQQPLSSQALFALQEIVQHICQQQKSISSDLIILSNSILNILNQQYKLPKFDKFMLIPALKHFKYVCTANIPMVAKSYCDSFVQIAVNKRIDGILEGQIREILKFIKNDAGISQHLVLIVKSLHLQDHPLFINLVKEYSYVQLEESNNKVIMNLEEQRYYEQEDSEEQDEQHPQQLTAQVERNEVQLDFNKIVRKREQDDDEDNETHIRQAKPSGIIFGDNCFKRIKMDNEDD